MQRSRSRRITVNSLSSGAGAGMATRDGEFHPAKVMVLGDFVRRQVADTAATAPAPKADSAFAKGRDLRGAVPAPRENYLLGALNEEDYARLIRHLVAEERLPVRADRSSVASSAASLIS